MGYHFSIQTKNNLYWKKNKENKKLNGCTNNQFFSVRGETDKITILISFFLFFKYGGKNIRIFRFAYPLVSDSWNKMSIAWGPQPLAH